MRLRSSLAVSLLISSVLCASSASPSAAQEKPKPSIPTLEQKLAGTSHHDGFLPLDWDASAGKLYLEIPRWSADRTPEFLFVTSLTGGAGSNDLGLDRGQLSQGRVVRFERVGPKILLVEVNEQFRTASKDPHEQLAVTQSFPESVLWAFKVEAESADHAVVAVDATDFFVHDAHGVAEAVAAAQKREGHADNYQFDANLSALVPAQIKAFPRNIQVESELTFKASGPLQGSYVRDVTPDPHALTVHEQIGFIELPPLDGAFTPRRFNPRAGYFPFDYRDMNVPLGEPLQQTFIVRHRLIKKDPNCQSSCEAVEPIRYYVDRGAPEPVRTALVQGASWWDQAYQAAGWAPGTFRVDLLPEDADPMDVRYNIIQWVHRYTRGWSYGDALVDPRTGEILKGNVTLGSLRARQDFLIAEALLSPYASGTHFTPENNPMLQMVLARIRQLSAHETGHTLGLAHNFAASTRAQSESVMDYPHPYVTLDAQGRIDLSHAYTEDIGAWDKVAIDYGYRQFTPGQSEPAELDRILAAADKAGHIFITDQDARSVSAAQPDASLWDNGRDPAEELERILKIRSIALANFSESAIPTGTPMAQLEETLVPLYLLHRYQTEAAAKMIGGLDFRYNLRGDGQPGPSIVSAERQSRALAAVLQTLSPRQLALPESLLAILPPHPPAFARTQESFPAHTGATFDPVAAAESAADLTLDALLNPTRVARIVEYHDRDHSTPGLGAVLEGVSSITAQRDGDGRNLASETERAVEFRGLEAILALAANPAASSQARAIARAHALGLLHQWASAPAPAVTAEAIHRAAMSARIQEFERDPVKFVPARPVEAPPGMPIGDDGDF